MNSHGQIEKDRGNEVWIAQEFIYKTSVNLDILRRREVLSQVLSFKSFDRCIYREVSKCPQQSKLDGSWRYQEATKETGDFSIDPTSYREVLRLR